MSDRLNAFPGWRPRPVSMGRIAVKDITLSDGTRIPEGTLLTAQAYAMHHDGALCDNARTFDPFRFARMRPIAGSGSDGQSANAKCLFTTTSAEYIPFGYGQYSCPGRYFASNELKAILACIILNCDMKLGGDGSRPSDVYTATSIMPAPHGRILFKKRGGSV
ncbi:hypothetical protein GSI_07450 [Ganoderma sinense ZZ0214-1]|uniref:Cytochrome P450 n=1 Tax=Ganoderma sinense ZZ0214-1 TaxID=1077348 RepID=A0A2G8S942_9APHY|nr:hypothetical protein GSI_07450 [Ganoderma sinense ZZ0214-1]